MSAHRYLGEISDVSFFNSAKALLQNESTTHSNGAPLVSYEREPAEFSNSEDGSSVEVTYVVAIIGVPCSEVDSLEQDF